MKTLLISGIYPPDIGGPATYVPNLCEYLIKNGHMVEVVTLKNSIESNPKNSWPVHYILRDQFLFARFTKATFIIFRKLNKIDSIFANGLFQETAVAISLRKISAVAKIVGDPVWERASNRGETNLNLSEFNQSKLKTKHKLQRYILAWSLNQFSYITCPSIQLIDLLKKWGVTKPIVLVTNGVKKVQQKKTNSDYDLITVCRLISLKNVDKIILASKNTNIKLAIIGTGPQQNELYKLSQSIGANVDFLGNLSSREVIITLLKSKIYINLSNHEGLSFSLLEAMSCGLPSVVSNIKGNTDVISNGVEGLVVELSDTKSIENAIKVLIKSPELQLKYGNAAKVKSQEQYSLDDKLQEIVALLNSSYKL